MVTGGITKDSMSKSKVYPSGISDLKVKTNYILCVHGEWIHR